MSETAIARRFSLPAIHRGNRGRAILLGGLALLVLYGIPVKLRLGQPRYLDNTVVDTAIPFLEWTIWIYLSQFPFLFLALWVTRDDVRRSHAFYAMLLSAALGLVVFALWPTIIGRQSPDLTGPTGFLWWLLYLVDPEVNAFPSLHVANACLAAAALYPERGAWRLIAPVWAGAIILSTLTTKQHYAIDVVGGVALAALCYGLVRLGPPYRFGPGRDRHRV
jgi:membrane-associated phospholipid phosphatase